MPKKIVNVRARLLEEARRQIEERGYKEMTVRSVAGALSLGLGTLYNYFESKDMLVASFMLEDWIAVLDKINERLNSDATAAEKLRFIYDGLCEFYSEHKNLFDDPGAKKTFSHTMSERHPMLLSQISGMVKPLLAGSEIEDKTTLADFISEAMLTWSGTGTEYSVVEPIFNKLI